MKTLILTNFLFLSLQKQLEGLNLCKDREVPANAHVVESYWFTKCNWECNHGYIKVGRKCCSNDIPENSTWSANCKSWFCADGFTLRDNICCKDLPSSAKWSKNRHKSCLWQCIHGHTFDGNRCIKRAELEKSDTYQQRRQLKEAESLIDNILEQEVSGQTNQYTDNLLNKIIDQELDKKRDDLINSLLDLELDGNRQHAMKHFLELGMGNLKADSFVDELLDAILEKEISKQTADDFVEDLLNDLLEQEDQISGRYEVPFDATVIIDKLVDRELERRQTEANSTATRTQAHIDALDAYLHNHTLNQTEYDNVDSADLEEEAQSSVDSLNGELEFLKATIRFQNERIRKRSAKGTEIKGNGKNNGAEEAERALRQELEEAHKRTELLAEKAAEAQRKLKKVQTELEKRNQGTLSVEHEKVELLKSDDIGSSSYSRKDSRRVGESRVRGGDRGDGGTWRRIRGALLDTGNANVCTISMQTAKEIGLSKVVANTKRFVSITGVIPGKTEQWPLVDIKLRIKDRVFEVTAAVGGSTPVLVSHTDVISRLLVDGFVIGGR